MCKLCGFLEGVKYLRARIFPDADASLNDVLIKKRIKSAEHKQSLSAVTLAAIGVVYGDIGTSPLYTLRECFSGHYCFDVRPDVVFGFLSLIFWMLIVIVSLKYLTYVMRADNAGEGGILTLMSLAGRNTRRAPPQCW